MNNRFVTDCGRLLVLLIVCVSVFVVCGEEGKEPAEAAFDGEWTDSMEIEHALKSTLMRWRYQDKIALYDLEFEYVQDEYSVMEYLAHDRISRASVDSLIDFRVTGIKFFGPDSALVDDELHWQSITGDTIVMPSKDMVYFHRGQWIRPTLGTSAGQKAYEESIRQADSAAAAEEEEGYK